MSALASFYSDVTTRLTGWTGQLDSWLESLHPNMAGVNSGQLILIGLVSLVGSKFICISSGGK